MAQERKVAIQHIHDTLANLTGLNKVYFKGQLIFAMDEVGNVGMKCGLWDEDTDPYNLLSAPAFNDLPWLISPSDYGSGQLNAFQITNSSTNGGIPQYSYVAGVITLTDRRFLGKEKFPIFSTAYPGGIRASQCTFDMIAGTVAISGMVELEDEDHFDIVLPTGIATNPDYLALTSRVTALESVFASRFAPFLPTGLSPGVMPSAGKVWYLGDVTLLAGTGWEVCHDMDGYYPIAIKAGDPDFDGAAGDTVGSKNFKIDTTNQLPKFSLFTVVDQFKQAVGHPSDFGQALSNLRTMIRYYFKLDGGGAESVELCGSDAENIVPTLSPTSPIGKNTPDDIKHLPPSKKGVWIHYTGI